jgi:hypothetical protein
MSWGDIGAALNAANPEELNELYGSLRLSLKYHHADQTVDVEVDPMGDRVDKVCVRRGVLRRNTRLNHTPRPRRSCPRQNR